MENQLRTEINQIILKLPENRLKPVLAYLRQVENATEEQANTANLVKKYLKKMRNYLKIGAMITLKEALIIHDLAIEKFGGSKGIRDMGLLESALQRPHATFDEQELYPTPIEKAAAIIESIVKNHPFSDGNKRTGYILMRLMLLKSNLDIEASEEEKYQFVISIAEGKSDFEEIKSWIENKVKEI